MRSNRLALVAVALGSGLLASSAAVVTAAADDLPAGTRPAIDRGHHHGDCGGREGDHDRPVDVGRGV